MNCPACGNDDTKVTRTAKDPEGEHIQRQRTCLNAECGHRFTSFECYEKADVEMPFQVAEARADLTKALGWLKMPARHIPVVRDALKLVERAAKSLEDSAISSGGTT